MKASPAGWAEALSPALQEVLLAGQKAASTAVAEAGAVDMVNTLTPEELLVHGTCTVPLGWDFLGLCKRKSVNMVVRFYHF